MREKTHDWHGTGSSTTQSAPLKASDFFPPGAGWNRQKNSETSDRQEPNEKNQVERRKQ